MNSKVTIIMYHYVRDIKNSLYPEIKGLDLTLFKEQVLYLRKYYNFISIEQLIDSFNNKTPMVNKAVMLTFDDAYIDHYSNVFPILCENNIKGAFFPPIKAIINNEVLDVNKLHFILASCQEKKKIIREIYSQLDFYRSEFSLMPNQWYYNKIALPDRYDSAEIIFIKRLLQVELNEKLRKKITNYLFNFFVKVDEKTFSRELYMNIDQLKTMLSNGMHIGSHGYDHYWLDSLTYEKQEIEMKHSIDFLKDIGVSTDYLTMCYPYGAYNKDTLSLMAKFKFNLGFSTVVDVATCSTDNRFHLPRLDTNDIPKNSKATPNTWYFKG